MLVVATTRLVLIAIILLDFLHGQVKRLLHCLSVDEVVEELSVETLRGKLHYLS